MIKTRVEVREMNRKRKIKNKNKTNNKYAI